MVYIIFPPCVSFADFQEALREVQAGMQSGAGAHLSDASCSALRELGVGVARTIGAHSCLEGNPGRVIHANVLRSVQSRMNGAAADIEALNRAMAFFGVPLTQWVSNSPYFLRAAAITTLCGGNALFDSDHRWISTACAGVGLGAMARTFRRSSGVVIAHPMASFLRYQRVHQCLVADPLMQNTHLASVIDWSTQQRALQHLIARRSYAEIWAFFERIHGAYFDTVAAPLGNADELSAFTHAVGRDADASEEDSFSAGCEQLIVEVFSQSPILQASPRPEERLNRAADTLRLGVGIPIHREVSAVPQTLAPPSSTSLAATAAAAAMNATPIGRLPGVRSIFELAH